MRVASPSVVVTTTVPTSLATFYPVTIAEFRRLGYQVHLVSAPGGEWESLRPLADQVHVLPMARDISPVADVRALWRWWRLLRWLQPEVVVAGTPKASLLSMLAAALTRVPCRVYHLLGLRLEGVQGKARLLLAALEWVTSRAAGKVVAVSPSLAEVYTSARLNAGRDVVVIGAGSTHGVDADRFRPTDPDLRLRTEIGIDADAPVVAFIGRLTGDKGPEMLLAAAEHLRATGCPVQYLVVGAQDEADSQKHVRAFEESGLSMHVTGFRSDVRPYLALADVLVLPSKREGMPNVVLEAASMGVPAVTTLVTGARDSVVDGETGFLVEYGDHVALADRIRTLVSDAGLRRSMGQQARHRVMEWFEPQVVARDFVSVVTQRSGCHQPNRRPRQ